jgi:hypothetical protein
MGYRGEDVSATQRARGRQTPWQSSSDDYAVADGGSGSYGPDGGYLGQGQPGQGQLGPAQLGPGQLEQGQLEQGQPGYGGQYEEQHGAPYGQQAGYEDPYAPQYGQAQGQQQQPGQYDGYEPTHGGAGGYASPAGYGQQDGYDYGYEPGANPPAGYGQVGYDPGPAAGYGSGAPGYGSPDGGYPGQGGGGYAGAGSYQGPGSTGTYQSPGSSGGFQNPGSTSGYQSPGGDSYPGRDGYPGPGGYEGPGGAGGYQSPGAGPGAYPGPGGGIYPGQGSSGYPGAGGDGYPGQDGYPDPGGHQAPGGYQSPGDGGYAGPGGSGGYQGPGGGSYQDLTSGYGQSSGYPAQSPASGSYPAQSPGSSGYPAQPAVNGGYSPQPAGTGGYPVPAAGTGAYPAPPTGTGGYPALPSGPGGGYPAPDAGNDWYGGQPAAASGASFADTGTYQLNGRAADEYGTGPQGALRDPVRGYPPGPGQPGSSLPASSQATSVIPAVSGPLTAARSGAQPVYGGAQQDRFTENAPYPGYGSDGSYQAAAAPDAYAAQDDYATRGDFAAPGGYGDLDQAPPPRDNFDRGEFADYGATDDPYQERYGDDPQKRAPDEVGGGRGGPRSGGGFALGPLRGKRLLLAVLAVVAVGIIGVAAYAFVLKPKSPASTPSSSGPLPTASSAPSQQACAAELGIYCHIAARTDDPTPLSTSELYPPQFTNETDKISYTLVSTKLDKTCSNAVIGSALISALKAGQCTQVLRGSYVSGNGKIMGTIGVVNLATTNEAHYAGKVVGQQNFIAPLTAAKGVASKLGNGTGVVEAEYKGHYLILTWSEFVNGTTPKTTAENKQLEQFGNDLVAGSANIALSQRQVTGKPAKAASA